MYSIFCFSPQLKLSSSVPDCIDAFTTNKVRAIVNSWIIFNSKMCTNWSVIYVEHVFCSKEALITWVKEIEKDNDFVIVIKISEVRVVTAHIGTKWNIQVGEKYIK